MNALLSSAYFPNIQYLSKIFIYDNIFIEKYETFPKQSFRNRCQILSANSIQNLIVPTIKDNNTRVKDVKIDYSENWRKNHLRAIMSSYKNSSYYDFIEDKVYHIIMSDEKYLIDLNQRTLDFILDMTGIKKEYSFTRKFKKEVEFDDFRNIIHPKNKYSLPDKLFSPYKYPQVFSDRFGFVSNLSCLDLIFNEGKESYNIIKKSIKI